MTRPSKAKAVTQPAKAAKAAKPRVAKPETAVAAPATKATARPVPLDRRGDRTLFALVEGKAEKRQRRYADLAVVSDAGSLLWGGAGIHGVAALSPSGKRVAVLSTRAVEEGAPGSVPVKGGAEEIVLRCHDLETGAEIFSARPFLEAPRPETAPAAAPPATPAPELPYAYRSALRAVAFVDDETVAVLVGIEPGQPFDRERILLWTCTVAGRRWALAHDEAEVEIDTVVMFRSEDGFLVVHGRDMPLHRQALVRIFEPRGDGSLRLRQSYEQPRSERTSLQNVDPGGWVLPHPKGGFLVQVFWGPAGDSGQVAPTASSLVHVDARTGWRTPLGAMSPSERPAVTSAGEAWAYHAEEWLALARGKEANVALRSLARSPLAEGSVDLGGVPRITVPKPHLVTALGDAVVVSVRGEALFLDIERREIARRVPVALPETP